MTLEFAVGFDSKDRVRWPRVQQPAARVGDSVLILCHLWIWLMSSFHSLISERFGDLRDVGVSGEF